MTVALVIGGITALGSIFVGLKYWTQIAMYFGTKSPEQKDQAIDQQVAQEKQQSEDSGRPS